MKKYALIGEKLSHSLSPCIHEAVFGELDLEAGYTLMEIPARFKGHIVQKLWYEGYKGANVTIPYKQTVLRQLDVLSPAAEKIGAVNTITLRDGVLYGDNTDYDGFGKMLSINGIETEGKTAAVLGTGGAAKAVVAYLLDHGVKRLCLVSRQAHKKTGFEQPGIEWMEYAALPSLKGDILINCTPVGMYPNTGVSPVDRTVVEHFEALVDLIYNPRQTEFLRLGQLCGKTVCDGLYMLVAQAVRSEEIWQQRV
ncbi:MAG: shikimate dehydrogenase family protein, partial [Christensenellales bacterium]